MSMHRVDYIAAHGVDAWRRFSMEKKRLQRDRRRARGLGADGKPVASVPTGIEHDGVLHPCWCLCYDCLYGEVSDRRRIIRGLQPIPEQIPAEDCGTRSYPAGTGTGHRD